MQSTLTSFTGQAREIFGLALLLMTVFAMRDVLAAILARYYPESTENLRAKAMYAAFMLVLTFVTFTYVLKRERLY